MGLLKEYVFNIHCYVQIGNSDIIIQPELEYLQQYVISACKGKYFGQCTKERVFFMGRLPNTQKGQASNVIRNLGSEFADYDIPTWCSFKLTCQP